jgi:pyrroline-5-carboxylate reductase
MSTTIGVVGTGNMGSALVLGWSRSSDPELSLLVYDVIDERARELAEHEHVDVASSLGDMAQRAQIIVVVVKPKDTPGVLNALEPFLKEGQVVVSAAAGVSLEGLRAAVGPKPWLFRIMPNLGVELGQGVVALSPSPGTPAEVISDTQALFGCMGVAEVLSEDMLDAVTAASGSSIAFLALAIEGMEDGAVRMGLPRATARAFIRQTAMATAMLLLRYPGSAADIKDQVASPGGTTIAGIAALEDKGVRGAFLRAIEEATERSRALQDTGPSPVVE